MTPDSGKPGHGWSRAIKSLAVGLFVFFLGREMAVWLTARNVHGFSAFLDNVLAGIAASLIVLFYELRRQRGVDKLRESEQRFRLVADAAPVLIWMSGIDKLCIYFNKPWLDFTGRPLVEELGNGWASGVHPDDLQRCLNTYTQSFDQREKFGMEYRLRRHDGEFRWILDFGVPRFNHDGSFAGYIGSCIDVTQHKRAEEVRLMHAAIVESSEDAIISKNLDAVIVRWNAGAERLFGYTEAEAVGQPITILIPPELRDEENKILETLRAGGRIEHYETTRVTKAGKKVDVSLIISPIKDSTGRLTGFSKIAHDISNRKRAEELLRETNRALEKQTGVLATREELLKIFVKNVPAGVAMLDRDMRYLQVSDRWCVDFSLDSSQMLGRSHYEVFPDIPERWKQLLRRALNGETLRADEDRWDREGGTVWLRWEIRPWQNLDGLPGGILIFSEDITHRKQAEETLLGMSRKLIEAQEQERARIGRELHDDINQRLAMLALELDQLQENPSDVQTRLQELRKRTTELSNDVQALSHELHSSKLEYLGVVSGIKSWCKEFGERQKMEIDFKSDVSSVLPLEVGVCLFRVLQEALHNAVKHSGMKRIEVQLSEHLNEVHFLVRDSGKGFDWEMAMQGRGLGLTSMQERVRLLKGSIEIQSKPMGGTSIHVRVPFTSDSDSMWVAV
jgi:PAS domain S-box-containing protein